MVYSSSYIFAKESFGNSSYYFTRQITFLALGVVGFLVASKFPFHFWPKRALEINVIFSLLLTLTLVPGAGIVSKGSSRWIDLYFVNFQPGEFVKYSILLFSIKYFNDFFLLDLKNRIYWTICLVWPLLIFVFQPDFGSFTICSLVIFFVCFLSSFPRKYFYGLSLFGLFVAIQVVFLESYRVKRILTYLDPWKDPKRSGFQIIQSYLGLANGSIFGQGIGNSNEKLFYLPEAHNDFIFSVVGEELGFVGVLSLIFLFVLFVYLGLRIALKMKDSFAAMTVGAIIFCIGLQAFLNMGVVLGLLPTKGLNLPFISSGGSSLITNFFALGLIFSASKYDSRTDPHSSVNSFAKTF